jgi:MFS family permease
VLQPSATRAAQRRITGVLFLSESLFSAALISAFTITPILAAQLSGSDSLAGLPATLLMIGRATAGYPLGWLMDRSGRRVGLTLGFLLCTFGLALSALAAIIGSFLLLCLAFLLLGCGRAASEQSRFAVAEIHVPAQRAKMIGLIVFASTIGAVGGPLLVGPSGRLAAQFGLSMDAGPYMAGTLLVVVAVIAIFLWLTPDPKALGALVQAEAAAEDPASRSPAPPVNDSLRQLFGRPMVQLALAAMVVGQLVMTMLMVITPLHMHYHDHSTDAVAWVIMAHTLGMFGLSNVTGWLIDRLGRIPMIAAGAATLVISSLLAPISVGVPMLAFSLFLLGLGWNFCFIAGSSLLSDSVDNELRGRAQGTSETLVALSSGMGSLGSGSVFALGGMTAVAAAGLAFCLALVATLLWLGRTQPVAQVMNEESGYE